MRETRASAFVLCAIAAASLLSSCATEPAEPLSSATPISSAACDQTAIGAAIHTFYSSTEASESTGLALQSVASVACADDWAVAQIVVGDGQGHDLHDYEVAQRVDGTWTVADRMLVCGTWNPKKPAQIPEDAAVDSSLYAAACTTN